MAGSPFKVPEQDRGKRRLAAAVLQAFMAVALVSLPVKSVATQETTTASCHIEGSALAVECTHFTLPLDWQSPDGPTLSVRVVRVKAFSPNPQADAIFVLAGGPGQAASQYFGLVEKVFAELRADRDIILMDQRGTGESSPLACRPASGTLSMSADELAVWAAQCFESAGFDASFLTSAEIVKDMEAVRRHFGYDRLNLWGGSFGTRLAQHYYRAFPEYVRSIVIDAVLAAEDVLFESAPLGAQRAFDRVVERCNADISCREAFGDIDAKLTDVLQTFTGARELNLLDPYSGAMFADRMDAAAVAQHIRTSLYLTDSTAWVPFIVHSLHEGNFSPLAAAAANGADWAMKTMYMGSTLSILCSEEIPRVDAQAVARAARQSFTADSYYQFWRHACSGWPDRRADPDMAQPVSFEVPTLMISGEYDPVTPPSNAEVLMKRARTAYHLLVPGGGHTNSGTRCVPEVIGAFVGNLDIAALANICEIQSIEGPLMLGVAGPVSPGGQP